jgi:carbon starvation protein CstA
MPVMIVVLCLMAIAYRYYSAFLAAKVAAWTTPRITPAVQLDDGQNYHPTSKWVLFGHHFAAISGAGPLIGPVLAAQFGYLPGLIWIVIGVCLGGAVQDFLVLSALQAPRGRSLPDRVLRRRPGAGTAAMVAIIFILIIALAGWGRWSSKPSAERPSNIPPVGDWVLPGGASTLRPFDGEIESLHRHARHAAGVGGQGSRWPSRRRFSSRPPRRCNTKSATGADAGARRPRR